MAQGVWEKIIGTLNGSFQVALNGVRLKNNAGGLQVRNPADSAFAGVAASAVDIQDANGQRARLLVPDLAGDYTLTLPADDGSPSQALTTDGAGVLSWTTLAGGTDKPVVDTTAIAFGSTSPIAMFTLPANAVITNIDIVVDTPFNGTPSLSIGITGTLSKYISSTEVDLTALAGTVFVINPGLPAPVASENLIATYAAGGASAGVGRILVSYVIPS